jgi:nitrate reductase (cytochrome), electron transfer subunit
MRRADVRRVAVRLVVLAAVPGVLVASAFAVNARVAGWIAGRPAPATDPPAARAPGAPAAGIPAEALVFRTRPGTGAAGIAAVRRGGAPRRDLASFRALRAYPGAPPRVPHGLTGDEFLATGCNACHERGGFATRFASYAPMTPHAEPGDCLQCHAVEDALVGRILPVGVPDAECHQCHLPGERTAEFIPLDWRAAAWPERERTRPDGPPPAIPHELDMRGNCLACHMGPAAVEEIRTSHPERSDCRQCHVLAVETSGFIRRDAVLSAVEGGAP